jgi:hypothetical protein
MASSIQNQIIEVLKQYLDLDGLNMEVFRQIADDLLMLNSASSVVAPVKPKREPNGFAKLSSVLSVLAKNPDHDAADIVVTPQLNHKEQKSRDKFEEAAGKGYSPVMGEPITLGELRQYTAQYAQLPASVAGLIWGLLSESDRAEVISAYVQKVKSVV